MSTDDAPHPALPTARTEPANRSFLPWLLPVAVLALTAWLAKGALDERGVGIQVEVDAGYGLHAGDAIRYRGIDVGLVERVRLADDGRGVVLDGHLGESAAWLAREGTRFWIARPEIGLGGIRGLDTIVGPRYLEVVPGEGAGAARRLFRGLEEPPVALPFEGGLEILLEATSRMGLVAGAPILYRDMPVGQVLSVRLSSDAQRVELRSAIAPEYTELVRADSRFYRAPGFELSASLLDGFRFEIASLEGLLSGAVSFATPQDGGDSAAMGQRYVLHEAPEKAWLGWSPSLAIGSALLPKGARVPEPRRGALRWKEGRILRTSERQMGWCLRLEDALLGPADVLVAPSDAREGTITLEVAGQTLAPLAQAPAGLVAELPMTNDPSAWPRALVRKPLEPESVLVFGDPGQGPRALDGSRLEQPTEADQPNAWTLSDGGSFSRDWHGAVVLGRKDGALLGTLIVEGSNVRIALR